MSLLSETKDIKRVLLESKTIAVLGAHTNESKAAYYVPRYLDAQGYDVQPVNPVFADRSLFGKDVAEDLAALEIDVDVLNVFRRSEVLGEHLEDILAMTPLPKVVWFQLGIKNDEVAKKLSDAGIDVIQDRCMLADHQRLL